MSTTRPGAAAALSLAHLEMVGVAPQRVVKLHALGAVVARHRLHIAVHLDTRTPGQSIAA